MIRLVSPIVLVGLFASLAACIPETRFESAVRSDGAGVTNQTVETTLRLDVLGFDRRTSDGGIAGDGAAVDSVDVVIDASALYSQDADSADDRVDYEILEDGVSIATATAGYSRSISSSDPALRVTRSFRCEGGGVPCGREYTIRITVVDANHARGFSYSQHGLATLRYTNRRGEEDGAIVTWTIVD